MNKLKQLYNINFNNYGVIYYEIDGGKVVMQAVKLHRKIPKHRIEIKKKYFEERFKNPERSEMANVIDALEFLDPDYQPEE